MAKMACYCGASMSNVDCPSDNIIFIMRKERIESAIKYNPQITLIDFITNWDVLTESKKLFTSEEYDFWYCTECKRVYQTEIKIGGNKLASYVYNPDVESVDTDTLFAMQELIVFTDSEEDSAAEKEPSVLLSDFVLSLSGKRFFISNDLNTVYAYDCAKKSIVYEYQAEKLMKKPSSDS